MVCGCCTVTGWFAVQLFVRLRESSRPLHRQTLNQSPGGASSGMNIHQNLLNIHHNPLVIDDVDNHGIDTLAVSGNVNIEFALLDIGRESVDVISPQADKDADADDVDNVSSSCVSGRVSQTATSSAELLTHYKVLTYSLFVCCCC